MTWKDGVNEESLPPKNEFESYYYHHYVDHSSHKTATTQDNSITATNQSELIILALPHKLLRLRERERERGRRHQKEITYKNYSCLFSSYQCIIERQWQILEDRF